ncbi:MAG: divergent polysaccharide deacetylase family protein [bacterium]
MAAALVAAFVCLALCAAPACAANEREDARLALVVDDFGFVFGPVVRAFVDLPSAVAVTVIPGTPFAREVASAAREAGHAVLIHLPMEPEGYPEFDPGEGAVMVADADSTVRAKVRKAIAAVPGAEGLNNHMGSRAMADPRIVQIVMEELRGAGLYFFDSHTGDASPARAIARENGVRFAENWRFWDTGYNEPAAIDSALVSLARRARRRGSAIGIGHPRRASLEVVTRFLAGPEMKGVRLVPLAELLEN